VEELWSRFAQKKPKDPIQKTTKAKKGMRVWLKWYSVCLATVGFRHQTPVLSKEKRKN
jgi:hypothetical protein